MSLLEVRDLSVHYGRIEAVRDVSFDVEEGATLALLGPNGAGKSSLLLAIAGSVRAMGTVRLAGGDLSGAPPHRRLRRGLLVVPEGGGLLREQTVADNLRLAEAAARLRGEEAAVRTREALALFPRLGERLSQPAGSLSGGEQRMLSLSRAFVIRPKVALFDELSLGLAPHVVESLFAALGELAGKGTTPVLVEQHVTLALAHAQSAVVLQRGSVAFSGPAGADAEAAAAPRGSARDGHRGGGPPDDGVRPVRAALATIAGGR